MYPEPYLPDVEVQRTNRSSLGDHLSASVIYSSHCLPQCGYNDSDIRWTDSTSNTMFYAIPMLLTFGLISGLFNLLVCSRHVSTSYNVYILGLVMASNCVLLTGWMIRLEDYMDHSDYYQYMYTYFRGLHSWFWYTSIWILVCMLLERFSMILSSKPQRPLFTPLQAGIITVLIYLFCCVSATPQFWEYQVSEIVDLSNEEGSHKKYYEKSQLAKSTGYRSVYFTFQLAVSMFLPYPLMIIIVVMLVKRRGLKSGQSTQLHQNNLCEMSTSVQSDGSTIVNKEDSETGPVIHPVFTRMLLTFTVFYLATSTPLNFLNIADQINPHINWEDEKVFYALSDLFHFLFYSFYSLQIVVFFSFCKNFKHLAIAMVCWCANFKCTWRAVPAEQVV